MKYISMLTRTWLMVLLAISTNVFAQTIPAICEIPAGDSIIIVYDVTINSGVTSVSNQGSISGTNFTTFVTNDPKTAAPNDPTITAVSATIFYPITTATDLSNPSQWTANITGAAGTAPANFTSADQSFNINNNVSLPTIAGALTVSGGSNMELNNTSGLIVSPSARLTVGTGSTVDLNNHPVVLKSDATGTASIGTITGTLADASNVTVERYIGPGPSGSPKRAWRLLTAPLQSAGAPTIYSSWQEGGIATAGNGTHITGGTLINGFDQSPANNPSILQYNNASNTLTVPANTNATAVTSQPGWFLFVRGDRTVDMTQGTSAPASPTVLRPRGTIKQGTQPGIAVAATNNTVVGNPYPSPIDWGLIAAGDRTNVANRFYVWDPKLTGTFGVGGYVLFDASTATPFTPSVGGGSYAAGVPNTLIQSGQAFFVNSTGSAGSLVLRESIKASTNQHVFRTNGGLTEQLQTQLMVMENGNPVPVDGVYSVFNENGNDAVTHEDAPEMSNFNENISIKRNTQQLALEMRPLVDANDTIFLNMERMKPTAYQLKFTPTNLAATGLTALVEDSYMQTSTAISLSAPSAIDFSVNSDAASLAADRFKIVFKPATTLPVNFTTVRAYSKGSNVEVEWTVATEQNIHHYEVEKSADGRTFNKIATVAAKQNNGTAATYTSTDVTPNNGVNFYRVKAIETNNATRYSAVVKVNLQKENAAITVYPNPAKDKQLNIQLINQPKGEYAIQLINNLGQVVYTRSIDHMGGSATQTVQFSNAVAKGVYQMVISSGQTKLTQQVIVE